MFCYRKRPSFGASSYLRVRQSRNFRSAVLVDFAKANEGPPTDPKMFAAQQKKLQDEMQKRADEARKKLKGQGTASASTH